MVTAEQDRMLTADLPAQGWPTTGGMKLPVVRYCILKGWELEGAEILPSKFKIVQNSSIKIVLPFFRAVEKVGHG